MTRYELKDKDKQAKYLAVFPDFLTALTNAMNHRDPDARWVSVQSGEYEYSVNVYPEEVETFAEYDPHAWNDYPNVTPPEGVLMRIEGQYAKRPELEYYGALMYLEGAWHFADTVEIADNVIVERFRPWNDEEAAK